MRLLTSFLHPTGPIPVPSALHRTSLRCSLSSKEAERPFFLNIPLTRNAPRSLPDDIHGLLNLPVLFLPVWRDQPLIRHTPDNRASEPVFWTPDQLRSYLFSIPHPLIVPLSSTSPPATQYFGIDVSPLENPPVATRERAMPLRAVLQNLSETDAYLVSHAKALLSWHASTIYCSRCATPTKVTQAGAARLCPNERCKTRNIYPRIMPSIMAAVIRPEIDAILLGRKASWPRSLYSILAGFAEIFECLEDTVVREVFEETGVRVQHDSVRYVASQPWPSSPYASLMSGFRAEVWGDQNSRIIVDEDEMEDARWFDRNELQLGLENGTIHIPGHASLARRLIQDWLDENGVFARCRGPDRSSCNGSPK